MKLKEAIDDGILSLDEEVYYEDDTIDDYKQEIERLTNLCNKYEEEHKTTFETWKKDIKVLTELEKFINIAINGAFCEKITASIILDKLKELKQGGSNEKDSSI